MPLKKIKKMPRTSRRKTDRWINETYMKSAVDDICNGLETPSTAARKYGLKRTTIIYRVEKRNKMDSFKVKCSQKETKSQPLLKEIFTAEQEKELMEYLNRYTYLPYDTSGSFKAARQLVYQFVKAHEIRHPKLWDTEKQATVDWIERFIQRNPQVNLKKPQADSYKDFDEASDELSDIETSNRTETDSIPMEEQVEMKNPNLLVKNLEPNIVNTFSCSSQLLKANVTKSELRTNNEYVEDTFGFLEPDCDMLIPMVTIKQEPELNTEDVTSEKDTKTMIQKLEPSKIREEDDVFNSFGRNIALQVKELSKLSQLDAYELMHEVQTTVNRRLTNKLRLTRSKEHSSSILLPTVIKIDDDDDIAAYN